MKKHPPQAASFSHLDETGAARMVNVGTKPVQCRRAVATGILVCQSSTLVALKQKALPKGDVLTVAQIAGVQAVKKTADLIPLCHPLPVDHIEIRFKLSKNQIHITCAVQTSAKTGVEMEALTGVSVAALTLYDMCKAVDKTMHIENIQVIEKVKQ